jgi:hypothetical protein
VAAGRLEAPDDREPVGNPGLERHEFTDFHAGYGRSPGPTTCSTMRGEENRRIWVAHSSDEGKTFARERPAFRRLTGACGCCGMRAFADGKGTVYLLYRGATEGVHRDMYLLTSADHGVSFQGQDVGRWNINSCPGSTAACAQSASGVLTAWETEGQVYCARIDPETGKRSLPVAASGASHNRKYPAVAGNAQGETILVWTEGMGWDKGGSLAWQVYNKAGKPTGRSLVSSLIARTADRHGCLVGTRSRKQER